MLIVNVYVIGARADCQRLVLELFAVLIHQLIAQFHVFRQTARSDVAHLTQLDDVAFLIDRRKQLLSETFLLMSTSGVTLPFLRSSSR